jgi:DNA-binding LacI/PurR family transcriptional regulator
MKTMLQLQPAAILYGTDPVDAIVLSTRLSLWCHVAGTVSVTGLDSIPLASAFSPGLTAVALPTTEPATLSAGLLNLAHPG